MSYVGFDWKLNLSFTKSYFKINYFFLNYDRTNNVLLLGLSILSSVVFGSLKINNLSESDL